MLICSRFSMMGGYCVSDDSVAVVGSERSAFCCSRGLAQERSRTFLYANARGAGSAESIVQMRFIKQLRRRVPTE